MINKQSVSEVVEEIKHSLKVLQNSGWKGFDCSDSKLNTLDSWNKNTDVSKETLQDWLGHWEIALNSLRENIVPAPLLSRRKIYFQAALEAILKGDKPTEALWPLLITWTEAVAMQPDQLQLQPAWKKALTTLGFAGKDYQIRLAAFDGYLDMCESLIIGEE